MNTILEDKSDTAQAFKTNSQIIGMAEEPHIGRRTRRSLSAELETAQTSGTRPQQAVVSKNTLKKRRQRANMKADPARLENYREKERERLKKYRKEKKDKLKNCPRQRRIEQEKKACNEEISGKEERVRTSMVRWC